jgi:Ca-activated chloride channel homolog
MSAAAPARTRVVAVLTAASLCAPALLAQTPSPSPFRLEVQASVVSITAVAYDKAGNFVHGLGPADVQVLEDGVPQALTYFREAGPGEGQERIPMSVVLVLDTSGSMNRNLRFLQEAASEFLSKLDEGDEAMVVAFNEGVRSSADFTGDVERLEQYVAALEAYGGTSLYDAVQYGLGRVKDRPGRKAVVVFTDGADNTSNLKEDEVVDYARSVEATVYSIGFKGETGMLARSPRGFLRKIAQETGGAYFFPDRIGDLIALFRKISAELRNEYALAYTPQRPPDNTWRAIQVVVKRPGVEVRVRKGYFALKRRGRAVR